MNTTASLVGRGCRSFERMRRALDPQVRRLRGRFEDLRQAFYADLWRGAASDVGAEVEDLGDGFLRLVRRDRWTVVREHDVMLDSHLAQEVAGHKPLIHRLLAERQVKVPHFVQYDLGSLGRAGDLLRQVGTIAVKPARGTGAGRGVTTQIRTQAELLRASLWAARFDSALLAEEHHPGASFRLLYLGGALIDAVRRDSPTVVGDGRHDVTALMAAETQRRLRSSPASALSPLTPDLEARITLRRQARSLSSVLPAGERMPVKRAVNQNAAFENDVVRAQVHPMVAKLGSEIAATLGLALVGIDLIAPAIDQPLEASGGVVNEVNTAPGLHHHALVARPSEAAPVASEILEYLLARAALPARWLQALPRDEAAGHAAGAP